MVSGRRPDVHRDQVSGGLQGRIIRAVMPVSSCVMYGTSDTTGPNAMGAGCLTTERLPQTEARPRCNSTVAKIAHVGAGTNGGLSRNNRLVRDLTFGDDIRGVRTSSGQADGRGRRDLGWRT